MIRNYVLLNRVFAGQGVVQGGYWLVLPLLVLVLLVVRNYVLLNRLVLGVRGTNARSRGFTQQREEDYL